MNCFLSLSIGPIANVVSILRLPIISRCCWTKNTVSGTHSPGHRVFAFSIRLVAAYANHISFKQRPHRTMMVHGRIICEGHTTPVCQKKKVCLSPVWWWSIRDAWLAGRNRKEKGCNPAIFLPPISDLRGWRPLTKALDPSEKKICFSVQKKNTLRCDTGADALLLTCHHFHCLGN